MDDVHLEMLNARLGYITGEKSIICSDIGLIEGEQASVMFDAGASPKQKEVLEDAIKKGILKNNFKYLIISHFHQDHIKNVPLFADLPVYGSKNTARYIHVNTIIENNPIQLDLGDLRVRIGLLPSSHAKGCVYAYVQEEQALFVGDALWCLNEKNGVLTCNKDITYNMIRTIRSFPLKQVIYGHSGEFKTLEDMNLWLDFLDSRCKTSKTPEMLFTQQEISKFMPDYS
jgi:glyoxylase-like metal-dependent hydrolase (beta-lactamase superfamily II)